MRSLARIRRGGVCEAKVRRDWLLMRHRVDPRCAYCQRRTNPWLRETDDLFATIDHHVPLSLGGKDRSSNWRLCCLQCNFVKGDLPARDFMALLNG